MTQICYPFAVCASHNINGSWKNEFILPTFVENYLWTHKNVQEKPLKHCYKSSKEKWNKKILVCSEKPNSRYGLDNCNRFKITDNN